MSDFQGKMGKMYQIRLLLGLRLDLTGGSYSASPGLQL